MVDILERKLQTFIAERQFPCAGAKSALGRDQLESMVARSLTSAWNDLDIHRRLMQFAWNAATKPSLFRSFAVLFRTPVDLPEIAFERHMWARIQSLTDKDVWLGQRPDPTVSSDPANPHFALSIGGSGFFVVGMHPNASRLARRFDYPCLIFNLHNQFEQLREEGRYATLSKSIIQRDIKLQGNANPMLAQHGTISAARQYSGRRVPPGWRAPFRRPPTRTDPTP